MEENNGNKKDKNNKTPSKTAYPWEGLDQNDPSTHPFPVPINKYDKAILDYLHVIEERSKTKVAKRIFSKALREIKKEIEGKH